MAVKVGDEWYVDGRKGPFQIEARNGWELEAQIKPGYIIMREADYLKDRYLDLQGTATFHQGKNNLIAIREYIIDNGS